MIYPQFVKFYFICRKSVKWTVFTWTKSQMEYFSMEKRWPSARLSVIRHSLGTVTGTVCAAVFIQDSWIHTDNYILHTRLDREAQQKTTNTDSKLFTVCCCAEQKTWTHGVKWNGKSKPEEKKNRLLFRLKCVYNLFWLLGRPTSFMYTQKHSKLYINAIWECVREILVILRM